LIQIDQQWTPADGHQPILPAGEAFLKTAPFTSHQPERLTELKNNV